MMMRAAVVLGRRARVARRWYSPEALDAESRAALTRRKWVLDPERDAISKDFTFADFKGFVGRSSAVHWDIYLGEAWGFMSRVALYSEALNHHPEWSNTYGTVSVTLTTHVCKGLSSKDEAMADFMDTIAAPKSGYTPL